MAKSLLIDYTEFKVTPQMITESEQRNDGRVIVSGVLQRANSKNQNEKTIDLEKDPKTKEYKPKE